MVVEGLLRLAACAVAMFKMASVSRVITHGVAIEGEQHNGMDGGGCISMITKRHERSTEVPGNTNEQKSRGVWVSEVGQGRLRRGEVRCMRYGTEQVKSFAPRSKRPGGVCDAAGCSA